MSAVKRVSTLVSTWARRAQAANFSAAATAAPQAAPKAAASKEATSAAPVAGTSSSAKTLAELEDSALLHLLATGAISPHRLEADLADPFRAVHLRRLYTAQQLSHAASAGSDDAAEAAPTTFANGDPHKAMAGLPKSNFDYQGFYKSILNTNCEAVIGYVPLPVGIVGPLPLDGKDYRVPLATTEGALVASTNRGCAAIRKAGGATTVLNGDGMTRAPLVRMPSLREAAALKTWLEVPANYEKVAAAFASTTRFGRLRKLQVTTAGRNVYIRFKCFTGDAMGMNMITKGVNESLKTIRGHFPAMKVMSLSGNLCTDKKPSAINWVDGRGKSVAAEVRLSGHVLKTVLKTNAEAMVDLNTAKNLVGSALAGSIGGFNAHAANIVTAVFLATGQDGAQNVESSTCLTLMELDDSIKDAADPEGKCGPGLVMSVTMPSVEVGTIGGGTTLPAQAACLELLGLRGSHPTRPGANSEQLARIVAGSVLAGELSLMSALTTNDLLNSHLKLNRKPSDAHGHGGHGGAGLITPAIQARLNEVQLKAAAEKTAVGGSKPAMSASSSSGAPSSSSPSAARTGAYFHHPSPAVTVAGSVPGGAPAGAHSHPLHLSGQGHGSGSATSLFSSFSSPGRRYFAAPTSTHHGSHRWAGASLTGASDAASLQARAAALGLGAANVAEEDSEPCLSVP